VRSPAPHPWPLQTIVLVNPQHIKTDEVNRLQKTLEGANLKLAAVATDVLSVTGRAMLEALLGGEQDPWCWRSWPAASSARSCYAWSSLQ